MKRQVKAVIWKNLEILRREEMLIFLLFFVLSPFYVEAPLENIYQIPIFLFFELYVGYFFHPFVSEHIQQQQNVQTIMGLTPLSFELSLLITNMVKFLSVAIFRSLATIIFQKPRFVIRIFSIFLYEFAQLSFCQFIKMLEISSIIKGFIVFLNIYSFFFYLMYFYFWIQEENDFYINVLASIFPTFSYYYKSIRIYEFSICFLMASFILYFTLLILCFYFKYLRTNITKSKLSLVQPLNDLICVEYSSAIIHQNIQVQTEINYQNKVIEIVNLTKKFGKLKAVDNISLQIYESQILCFFGHNGAGKSTLISLLTGLIKRDYGKIKYYDMSLKDNLNLIHKMIGYCPQNNVLYDNLTVFEHLKYYGQIKGLSESKELTEQIEQTLKSCQLELEKDKFVKHLSQGNKRQLCLGLAMIGGSKIIFLDEPTSGMDPVTRRKIWNILQQMKIERKCLILTTHHLDEAEVLSERIAIMDKGKLLTVGSVDFLKQNFGIGYHLNIYNLTNNQNFWKDKTQKIKSLVINQIKKSKLKKETTNECVCFSIPFDCKNQLLSIFQILEKDNSIQINLMINTLEEVFINIGKKEEAFLKKAQNGSMIKDQVEINFNDEFAKIIPPNCLKNDPQLSFYLQFKACLLLQFYSGKIYFLSLVNLILIISIPVLVPILIQAFAHDDFPKENKILMFLNFVFFIQILLTYNLILERRLKFKQQIQSMGCQIFPYWISNIIINLILLSEIFLINLLSFFNIQLIEIATTDLFLSLISQSTFCGCMQQLFPSNTFGIILYILFVLFLLAAPITLKNFNSNVLPILIPQFTLTSEQTFKKFLDESTLGADYLFIFILIFQTISYLCLAVAIDHRQLLASNQQDNLVGLNDNDVIEEARRVQDNNCQDKVIAKQISKTYQNGFQALKGTSFGVESGQIFGLLGPNGSGKSTTFNMITCRLKPTSGIIKFMGQEIDKGQGQIFQSVGICPQFEYLYPNLTVRQHLKIWALIKGLDKNCAEQAIQYLMKIILLTDYENKKAKHLSIGTKKKLQVALALMGSNRILFFDEPSSSMDLIARKYYIQAIQNAVKCRNASVILTTHLMTEAEQICTKIAIQVNGEFQCFGQLNDIVKKFGSGHKISLQLEQIQMHPNWNPQYNKNIQILKFTEI